MAEIERETSGRKVALKILDKWRTFKINSRNDETLKSIARRRSDTSHPELGTPPKEHLAGWSQHEVPILAPKPSNVQI
jgi:hypothetical protein